VERGGSLEAGVDEDDTKVAADEFAQAPRTRRFHLVMACAAMYMAMLLTTWGSTQDVSAREQGSHSKVAYDLNKASMWIKISTQWATILLYTWTLVAPLVLKNRDFS